MKHLLKIKSCLIGLAVFSLLFLRLSNPAGAVEAVWPESDDCFCHDDGPGGFSYHTQHDCDGDNLYNWEEDVNVNCMTDAFETASGVREELDHPDPKDTDSDGIGDLYEIFKSDAAHNAYIAEIGQDDGPDTIAGLSQDVKNGFRCPAAADPFNCDGDEFNNGNDTDADNDGANDSRENCDGEVNGDVNGKLVWDSRCLKDDNPYAWQETDPYNPDSDGDGLSDDPAQDVCPYEGSPGNPIGDPNGDVRCVRKLCRPEVMNKLAASTDTDNDGRPDLVEDVSKDCRIQGEAEAPNLLESDPYFDHSDTARVAISGSSLKNNKNGSGQAQVVEDLGLGMARVRVLNAAGQNYSYVVVQYAATGNGDGKADGHDACPLDETATCDGVCVPGASTVLSAETNPATQVARRRANVNEQCADYDDDGLCDGEEDLDDNCQYNRPEDGEASRETDWRNGDTDGDAALRYEGGGPSTGIDSIDECPHFAPSEVGYPDCRRFYCDRSFPDRIRFKHTAGVDTDDDGITDIHEDPDQDCQANPDNPDLNILHLDPFDPDTDGDGFNDGEDQCPGAPNATQDMEDITFCGYDNIGGNSGPFNHCVPDSAHPIWAGANGQEDSDRDGIPNVQEDSNGNCSLDEFESNPFLRDTDGDGKRDDEDACPWSSDIYCVRRCIANQYVEGKDSDGDGLKDVEEDRNQNCHYFGESENVTGETEPWDTNPFLRDSDGDGINDKVDGCQGTDPGLLFSRNADGRPDVSNDELECARSQCVEGNGREPGALKDSDGDFIPDVKEDLDNDCQRTSASGETDRFDPDTDDDGILDGIEDINRNGVKDANETDPRYADTDGDGIPDGVEDYNQNGRVDLGELDPKKADSDGDTISDNIEDRDHDGLWDASVNGQSVPLTGPCRADGNGGNPETSGYLADSDLDGIPDNLEDLNGNGQFTDIGKKYEEGIEEVINDITQGIGVKEFGETHPCDEDTDNDGLHDGQEDKNKNGAFEPKEGETSPLSPHTFGEPDMSRLERRLGMSGCSLIR